MLTLLQGYQLPGSVSLHTAQAVTVADTFALNINTGDNMDIISLIILLAVGALVGWIAGLLVKGRGFGVIGNIIVGVIGSVFGGYIFNLLNITTGGIWGSVIMAVIGAVVLLYIISIIKKI